jgi:hypothetical protein
MQAEQPFIDSLPPFELEQPQQLVAFNEVARHQLWLEQVQLGVFWIAIHIFL